MCISKYCMTDRWPPYWNRPKKGDPRPQHQFLTHDDEWDIISLFSAIVKNWRTEEYQVVVEKLKNVEC